MITPKKTTLWAASLLALTMTAPAAFAQSATPAQTDEDSASRSDDIVVTGTARSSGLSRLDAGFSITTVTAEDIQRTTPLTTADVLKNVPGTYIESSGGVAGLRVSVRGFPMVGGGQFSTVQLDGSTLFPPGSLGFIEGFSLFRVDDTVERVEVLRGGPSPIFSSGQPGITLNFIQKKGGEEPEGSARVTVGAEGLYRFDGFVGGKIGEGWYATLGGFYRVSDGVRDPQFNADRGGQVSATLTRRWDDGEVTVYARRVKDSNIFFTGAPLLSSNNGKKLSVYPYFDQRKHALAGNDTRLVEFEVSPGATPGTIKRDFSDGRTINLSQFGASFDFTPGDWSISNKVSYLAGDTDSEAIFTSAIPQTLGSYIAGRITAANGNAAAVTAAGRTATAGTATFATSGAAITDPNQPVLVAGFWSIDKHVETFTNDFRVSRSFGNHTLTVGNYFANYSIRDLYYQGNNALLAFEPNARLINLTLNNGVRITKNGFTSFATNNFSDSFEGQNIAGFVADEWEINDNLRVDGGLRVEHFKTSGSIGLASNMDLDSNPLTFYNNTVSVLNGKTQSFSFKKAELSYTLGANYHITPRVSTFARINSGFRFPIFDEIRTGFRSVQKIDQYEIGFKTSQRFLDAYLTLFYNDFEGQTYAQQIVNPITNAITTVTSIAGSRTYGAELEGALRPFENLSIGFNATLFNARFTGIQSGAPTGVQNGNKPPRQPAFTARVSPSYTIPFDGGDVTVFGAYTHVGSRFSDVQNAQKLPAYDTVDLGIAFNLRPFELQLTGSNLTNALALTEGNARIIGTTDGSVIARSNFGRSFQATAVYRF